MKKTFGLLLGVLLSFSVASTFAASDSLINTSWSLSTYNGSGAVGTLSFDETMMHSKFCNNVNQGYSYSNNTITPIGMGMSTMMYCEGLPMKLENSFKIATGTKAILNGNTLTITTSGDNVFFFNKDLPKVCTMEYAPVCGMYKPVINCLVAPCPAVDPVLQTYGNRCQLNAQGAEYMYDGECNGSGVIIGGDKDEYGCITSAGYTRGIGLQQCIKTREPEGTLDFAIQHNITAMKTMKSFRYNDTVTRQEAAKMIFSFITARNIEMKQTIDIYSRCNKFYRDDNKIAKGLKESVYAACALGFMNGREGSFHPYLGLTRGQALMVLMKIADGTQEDRTPYYTPYIDRANYLGFMEFANYNGFNNNITRGELIEWMKNIYTTQKEAKNMNSSAQKNLNDAKIVWKNNKLSGYNVTQTVSCFCVSDYTRPMTFSVNNNSIDSKSLLYADDKSSVSIKGITLNKVEDMFALIQNAINNKAYSITVSYDSTLGYPTSISIDSNKMIADEEKYYTFSIK